MPEFLKARSLLLLCPLLPGPREPMITPLLRRIPRLCSRMDTYVCISFQQPFVKNMIPGKLQKGFLMNLRGEQSLETALNKDQDVNYTAGNNRNFTTKKPDLFPFLKIGNNCSSKYLVQRYRMQHNFVHFKIPRAFLLPMQRSQPS